MLQWTLGVHVSLSILVSSGCMLSSGIVGSYGSFRASLVAQPCRRPWFDSWVRKFPWRKDRLPTLVFMGFPGGSDDNESACNSGDPRSIPGLGRFRGGGHGNPLQYSSLENPHGQRSLVGYTPWGCKDLDMIEWLSTAQHSKLLEHMNNWFSQWSETHLF